MCAIHFPQEEGSGWEDLRLPTRSSLVAVPVETGGVTELNQSAGAAQPMLIPVWLAVWLELDPPLLVCVTDVEDVLPAVAAPVVTAAVLFPVLADVEPWVAEPPVLPVVAPTALSPLMLPPLAEASVVWPVPLAPQTPDDAALLPLFDDAVWVVVASAPWVTIRCDDDELSSSPPWPPMLMLPWVRFCVELDPPLLD